MKNFKSFLFMFFSSLISVFAAEESSLPLVLMLLPGQTFELDPRYVRPLRAIRGSLITEKFANEKSNVIAIKMPDAFYGISPEEVVLTLLTIGNLYANPSNMHDKKFVESMRSYLLQAGTTAEENLMQQLINFRLQSDFFQYHDVVYKTDNLINILSSPMAVKLTAINNEITDCSPTQIIKKLVNNQLITREMFVNFSLWSSTASLMNIVSYIKNYVTLYNALTRLNNILLPLNLLEQISAPSNGRPRKILVEQRNFLYQQFKKAVKEFTGCPQPTVKEYNEVVYFMLAIFASDAGVTFPYRKFKELKDSVVGLPDEIII